MGLSWPTDPAIAVAYPSVVRHGVAMAGLEVQVADEAGDRGAALLDVRGDRGGREIEAEQRAHDHVGDLEPVLAEQDEGDDAQEQHTGYREDHDSDSFACECPAFFGRRA